VTRDEQETIIRFSESDAEADVYTSTERIAIKLEKAGLKAFKTTKQRDGKLSGWFFKVPKWTIGIKPVNHNIRLNPKS
jgi:antibiotic biosynthesis monooxygenase (ABM) superfamily enzyme